MEQLSGRVALVTGSSQGLGKVVAEQLAAAGCRVVINAAREDAAVQAVLAGLVAAGYDATAQCFDVADEAAVGAAFAALAQSHGGVDILINNARVDPYFRRPEMSEGQWWDLVMQVNLKGAFLCSLAFFQQAQARRWGRIVNVSSVRAFAPAEAAMIAYGVSKLGLHGLTRSYAAQGASYGITANSVAPGMIITENIDRRLTPEMKARECAKIPLGRGATCAEIADAILFVVRNGYVTGETININGGMHYAP